MIRQIRLINTTTRLPVDRALEDGFFAIADPAYLGAVLTQSHAPHIDVFLVSQKELDDERHRYKLDLSDDSEGGYCPHIDLLGVYIWHHADFHRPVIKVSPEKVMAASQRLKTNHGIDLPLKNLYSAMLHAVIIHELAHALMDPDASVNSCDEVWQDIADQIDKVKDYNPHQITACQYRHFKTSPHLILVRHYIEESLANSFILKQNFGSDALAAIDVFTKYQPEGYKRGPQWVASLDETLRTALEWRRFKYECIERRWVLLKNKQSIMSNLVEVLKRGDELKTYEFISPNNNINSINIMAVNGVFYGDLDFSSSQIGSFDGAPKKIYGYLDVSNTNINSFDNAPEYIDDGLDISGANVTSFKEIHKHIKEFGEKSVLIAAGLNIESGVSDLFYVKNLNRVVIDSKKVNDLLDEYLPRKDLVGFMTEMIEIGLGNLL